MRRRAATNALAQWLADLASGDSVAWGFLWVVLGALGLFGLVAGIILWRKRKEDQAYLKKYGRRV